jgi:hypothetical protein
VTAGDPDTGVTLEPALCERVDAQMGLAEALTRLWDAVEDDPESAAALRDLLAATQRWLDAWVTAAHRP